MPPLRGSFWVFVLYDVAEQIQLDRLPGLVGAETARRGPNFKHPTPEYVRFERPPVTEYLDPVSIGSDGPFQCRLNYFDYGVVSVELELAFEADWDQLVRLSSRWITGPDIEKRISELIRTQVARCRSAFVQPYESWLSEEYYVIQLNQALDGQGQPMQASALLVEQGAKIAQIVRGESVPLSDSERNDALQSSMSYYPNDLLVVGWVAALVYDVPEGAAPTIQLLEYANTQLLEFRHYDDLLTRVLENVYKMLDRRGGFLRHWRMARHAERLNAIRLEVRELTERTDNAIKFLSDMFYARAYRVAANRVGVTDYRNLVEQKLRIAGDLYESMINDYHQARAFILEVMVVAILVIELVHLFAWGR